MLWMQQTYMFEMDCVKYEQYMLSYDSNIIVGNGSERLPWTRIDEEDLRIYSREIFIYKRQEDHWTKWSRSLLRSVTNGFNYIEYGRPGKAFPLDNGWIILELQWGALLMPRL